MNPYAIIVALIVFAASCAGSAWLGYDYRDGKVAKEVAKAQADTLEGAIIGAAEDKARAVDEARKAGMAEERVRSARTAGVQDATLKARIDCGRDDVSLGLLNTAIDAANGAPANTRGMSQELRSVAGAGGR